MTDTSLTSSLVLRCPICGNVELFYQVQEHAENLVDGNLNHLHLLFADTAFYECYECHAQIAPPEYN
jgi:hypothetical protein